MKILDHLKKSSIIVGLKSVEKKGVIEELIMPIVPLTGTDHDELVSVLMDREHLGSTGIGGGIGIPHGKLKSLDSLVVSFGLSHQGVDFESLDGRPTHIFFLLLTPENSTGLHLKLLARISKILKNDSFKESLLSAKDIEEVYSIIEADDEEF